MRVIGYAYEADLHCIECARERFARIDVFQHNETLDEHDIPEDVEDTEGDNVHPIFSTDEIDDDDCCGDCFDRLRG